MTPRDFTMNTSTPTTDRRDQSTTNENFDLPQFSYTAKDLTADCSREYKSMRE